MARPGPVAAEGSPGAPAPPDSQVWEAPADIGGVPADGEKKSQYETCSGRSVPAVALRGNGALVAAWWAFAEDDEVRLFWSERPAGSRQWTPSRKVAGSITQAEDPEGYPRLFALPDGSVQLVLLARKSAEPDSGLHFVGSTLAPNAQAWTRPETINDAFGADLRFVGLPGGGLAATWSRDLGRTRGSGTPRFAERRPGRGWSVPEALRTGPSAEYRGSSTGRGPRPMRPTGGQAPAVAVTREGTLVSVWDDDVVTNGQLEGTKTLFRVRAAGQSRWSAPKPVGLEGGSATPFGFLGVGRDVHLVRVDEAGHVVWAVLKDATAWGPVGTVSSEESADQSDGFKADDVRLTGRPDGTLLLSWRTSRVVDNDGVVMVNVARLAPGATQWERMPAAWRIDTEHHGSGFTGEGRPFVAIDSLDGTCQRALLVEAR